MSLAQKLVRRGAVSRAADAVAPVVAVGEASAGPADRRPRGQAAAAVDERAPDAAGIGNLRAFADPDAVVDDAAEVLDEVPVEICGRSGQSARRAGCRCARRRRGSNAESAPARCRRRQVAESRVASYESRHSTAVRGLHDFFVEEPFEGIWMCGFGEKVIESSFARALPIFLLAPSGQRDEPHRVSVTHSNLARNFVAVHVGKTDVEQEHAWGVLLRRVQRGAATVRNIRVMPHQAEQHSQHLGRIHIIVHDKHPEHDTTIIPRCGNRGSPSERTCVVGVNRSVHTRRSHDGSWVVGKAQPQQLLRQAQLERTPNVALSAVCHLLQQRQPAFLRSGSWFSRTKRGVSSMGSGCAQLFLVHGVPRVRSKFPVAQN